MSAGRSYLACAPSEHQRLKRDLRTFAANVCGLYEFVSGGARYLSGTCARCCGDVSMRIGQAREGAPQYAITRNILTEVL